MRSIHVVASMALLGAALGCTASTHANEPSVPANVTRDAHELLTASAACFFGGIWGDVQGETPAERQTSSHLRCNDVVVSVFGHDDHTRYVQLRALDEETLQEVKNKIAALANATDRERPQKDMFVGTFMALAHAERETMFARRAASRLTRDVDNEPDRLSVDEAAALPQLESSAAFAALASFDGGALRKEVDVYTVMVLLDRMRVAEELPVHLKPYVVADAYRIVFGIAPPPLPHDASKPLAHGEWLVYLSAVATSAHHPVTNTTASPEIRHEAAMAGILEGLADKLRADTEGVATETALARITQLVIRSLAESRDRVGTAPVTMQTAR